MDRGTGVMDGGTGVMDRGTDVMGRGTGVMGRGTGVMDRGTGVTDKRIRVMCFWTKVMYQETISTYNSHSQFGLNQLHACYTDLLYSYNRTQT